LITITKFDASSPVAIEAHAMTETIDISEPDYPGEGIPTLAGGRVWKQSPQEDGEVTLEFYPIETSTQTDHVGLFQQWMGGTYDTSDPLLSDTSWTAGIDRTRDRFRISILWTNDNSGGTEPTDADSATAASTDSLRFAAIGCRITSHKTDFTDGILKVTATLKFPAMNEAGTVKMFRWESGDQTALGAIAAYDDEDSWT
jgi:hypothetical protein